MPWFIEALAYRCLARAGLWCGDGRIIDNPPLARAQWLFDGVECIGPEHGVQAVGAFIDIGLIIIVGIVQVLKAVR